MITSVGGKVTLKGPVRSAKEQARILKSADLVAGAANVNDELDVVPVKK